VIVAMPQALRLATTTTAPRSFDDHRSCDISLRSSALSKPCSSFDFAWPDRRGRRPGRTAGVLSTHCHGASKNSPSGSVTGGRASGGGACRDVRARQGGCCPSRSVDHQMFLRALRSERPAQGVRACLGRDEARVQWRFTALTSADQVVRRACGRRRPLHVADGVLAQAYAVGPQEIRFRQGQLRYAR
jgi:hypothetical protein